MPKCLESIINQTYKNLQIICVDDGSPDNCGDIIDDYASKDSRIVVIHKDNGGISSARNAGLEYLFNLKKSAPEKYSQFLTFIDSDDFIDTHAFSALMQKFTSNIDLICFGHEKVSSEIVFFGRNKYIPNYTPDLVGHYVLTDDLIDRTTKALWGKIFRTEIITQLEEMDF